MEGRPSHSGAELHRFEDAVHERGCGACWRSGTRASPNRYRSEHPCLGCVRTVALPLPPSTPLLRIWPDSHVIGTRAASAENTGGAKRYEGRGFARTGATGLEPATSGVTGRRSNQLNYAPGDGEV